MLSHIEPGAMVLIIGGSPCQQLTTMGKERGATGLCGPDSKHFFALPLLRWAVETARPDLITHVLAENAGSMLPIF
eukprot:4055423-Heterocapsa_arctica.AAC.1